jgi:anhydro-N-acetylmuramic acid kinase
LAEFSQGHWHTASALSVSLQHQIDTMKAEDKTLKTWTVLGLMSGSSLDGLDLAAVRITPTADGPWQWEVLAAETQVYSDEWTTRLRDANTLSGESYAKLHVDYGHLLGLMVRRFCIEQAVRPDLVSSHGHTVYHQPHIHFTAQIGCGETLVTHLACPLVSNLRAKDVALGGEGAPLVPAAEMRLFPDFELFLNLGGIANLSVLPRTDEASQRMLGRTQHRRPPACVALDVAPCNQVLNAWANLLGHPFDANGSIARSGQLIQPLFAQLETLPFYSLPAPRTLGREWVSEYFVPLLPTQPETVADVLHTVCCHVGAQTATELARLEWPAGHLLVTGGGAHNAFLIECLRAALAPSGITPVVPDDTWVNFKEAICFAALGLMAALGQSNTLAGGTGARQAVAGGSFHFPPAYSQAVL